MISFLDNAFALIILFIFIIILISPIINFLITFFDIFTGDKWKIYNKEENTRYRVPIITYYFSFMPILFLTELFNEIIPLKYMNQDIYIFWCVPVYIMIFYIGMYRKTGKIDNGSYFLDTLKVHRSFLKLSFLPITFFMTIIGFIFGFWDKIDELSNTTFSLEDISDYIFDLFTFSYITNKLNVVNSLLIISKTIFVFYILSLPIQILSYFINQVTEYLFQNGKPYLNYIKFIRKIFKYYIFK